ncbi:MAG: TetR family transcriptional regulator [Ruminococcus sp.]|nr:TetR family transcriptional regulator [Ruminococcus sp.]
MPKVTEEHKENRKQEIIDACEKIYRERGFTAVNIKEISTATSFTRPAIYSYFETKDEILLALLNREYAKWISSLDEAEHRIKQGDREDTASRIAHTLDGREILLRLQNMNLFEMEINCRVERLAEFKALYRTAVETLTRIARAYSPHSTKDEITRFCINFNSFLFGVYPFVYHTEKQLKAMELADVPHFDTTVFDMAYGCLLKLLP